MKRTLSLLVVLLLSFALFSCKPETFIVSFDLDGGYGLFDDKIIEKNKTIKRPSETPTKAGYKFVYWEYQQKEFVFETHKVVNNITLKALWRESEITSPEIKWLVTFDSEGGTSIDTQEVKDLDKVAIPVDPTKKGYVFMGWHLNDELYDFEQIVTSDIILVALWVDEKDIRLVTIVQNNGENDLILPAVNGHKLTRLPTIKYDGYGFYGLYKDFEFEEEFDYFNEVIDEAITLYVSWVELIMETAFVEKGQQEDRGTLDPLINGADRFGLDINYFDFRTSGSGNKTGKYDEIRIYLNNKLTITMNESFVINKVVFHFTTGKNTGVAKITLGNEVINESNYRGKAVTYSDLNINKIEIASTTDQVHIQAIDFYYFQVGEDVIREDDINRPVIEIENSLIISSIGETIDYPLLEANDEEDGQLMAIVDNNKTNVDIHKFGIYYIHYYSEDSDGNIGYGFITVIIREVNILENYYGDLTNTGNELQNDLKTILQRTEKLVNYGTAKEVLEIADRDPNNFDNVWLIYNSASIKGKWQHPNYAREHVWAKSKFGGDHSISNNKDGLGRTFDDSYIGAASDLHNLRAINPSVNSTHSNHQFGILTSSGQWGIVNGITPTTFYPGDEHKGDTARIILYMMLMWDITPREDLNMLVQWHLDDPVDNFEIIRNEVIYSYQDNRNPFIDYPELVEQAFQ